MKKLIFALCEQIAEHVMEEINRRQRETFRLLSSCERSVSNQETRLAYIEKQMGLRLNDNAFSANTAVPKLRINGKGIIRIQTRQGVTQATFARLLGVDRASVSRWEHDKFTPSAYYQQRIVEFRRMGKGELSSRLQKIEEDIWNNWINPISCRGTSSRMNQSPILHFFSIPRKKYDFFC